MDSAERFWAKVQKGPGCWVWVGCLHNGYGQIRWRGKIQWAHRVSWELANGVPPPPRVFGRRRNYQVVMHLCMNTDCVRPDHLKLGAQSENMNQHRRPRRYRQRGKLSESQREEIRELLARGLHQADLARLYGVSQPVVSWIKNGYQAGGKRRV